MQQAQPETLAALANLQTVPRDYSGSTLGTNGVFDRIINCALVRVSRKHGTSEPRGRRAGYVFFLNEKFDCCRSVNKASHSQPNSELQHGCSLTHLVHEFGVVEYVAQVRILAGAIEKQGVGAALKLLEEPKFRKAFLAVFRATEQ